MGELVISYATANDWITCRLSAILCLDFHDCLGSFLSRNIQASPRVSLLLRSASTVGCLNINWIVSSNQVMMPSILMLIIGLCVCFYGVVSHFHVPSNSRYVLCDHLKTIHFDQAFTPESRKAWIVFRKAFEIFSKEFVHGDLRKPNVLYGRTSEDQENKFYLIDFDWSGSLKGIPPRYPISMNCDELSCLDFAPGAFIKPEHDWQMLRKLSRELFGNEFCSDD